MSTTASGTIAVPALANAHGCANSVTPRSALVATAVAADTLSGPAAGLGSRGEAAVAAPGTGGCLPGGPAATGAAAGTAGACLATEAQSEAGACSPDRGSSPLRRDRAAAPDPNAGRVPERLPARDTGLRGTVTAAPEAVHVSGSVSCTSAVCPRSAMGTGCARDRCGAPWGRPRRTAQGAHARGRAMRCAGAGCRSGASLSRSVGAKVRWPLVADDPVQLSYEPSHPSA